MTIVNPLFVVATIIVLLSVCRFVGATGIPCNTTKQCEETIKLGSSSVCLDTGFCSNPFYNKGCLGNLLSKSKKTKEYVRVCSSSDPPEAEILGYCRSSNDWNYTEIRFMGNNWESVVFENWIVQIILSEILGVPTSVDTGYSNKVLDFYDIHSRMEYGKGFDWDAMRMANTVKDCTKLRPENHPSSDSGIDANKTEYKSCAHVMLEAWLGQKQVLDELSDENVIENPLALGLLAYAGGYIPKFTGESDPTLMSYLGYVGDENRVKLAKAFLRPTKWVDYCKYVSKTNCTVPDDVAQRAPLDLAEENRMFVGGLYTGHFRNTTENDCDLNPNNCTGHIVDTPCGWSTYTEQQTYHLKMALQSDGDEPYAHGYMVSQLAEIWYAANATKSNVFLIWWTPDSLLQRFKGTHAEFQRVTLPTPSQECFENRVNPIDRCSANVTKRRGSPEGACDDIPQLLTKVVTNSLHEICEDPDKYPAMYSPAYELIRNFEINNLQVSHLFDDWLSKKLDEWGYDPRLAVCEWVVENFDTILDSFVPKQYPRVLKDGDDTADARLTLVSLTFGVVTLVFVIGVSGLVYIRRRCRVMVLAQVEFLILVLFGLILVQSGSLTLSIQPTNVSCILAAWMVNLGYTLELVPLIVKVSAMNRLMVAVRESRRVKVQLSHLLAVVFCLTICVVVYLTVWSILDPRRKANYYELTNETDENDETIVNVYSFCRSEDQYWSWIALVWRCLLLLWATILAFQTRNSPVQVNESKTLAIMIYSQFVFVAWSLVLFLLEDSNIIQLWQLAKFQSLVISTDVCAVCCIYFVPKLIKANNYSIPSPERSPRATTPSAIAGTRNVYTGTLASTTEHDNHQDRQENAVSLNDACANNRTGIPESLNDETKNKHDNIVGDKLETDDSDHSSHLDVKENDHGDNMSNA